MYMCVYVFVWPARDAENEWRYSVGLARESSRAK